MYKLTYWRFSVRNYYAIILSELDTALCSIKLGGWSSQDVYLGHIYILLRVLRRTLHDVYRDSVCFDIRQRAEKCDNDIASSAFDDFIRYQSEKRRDQYNEKMETLLLSKRTERIMESMGLDFVGQLIQLDDAQLRNDVGRHSYYGIVRDLETRGLSLGMDVKDWVPPQS